MGSELGESPIAMQTLVFVAVSHERSDDCPFFGVQRIKFAELLILLGSPSLDPPFFGVEMLLADFHINPHSVVAVDGHLELTLCCFFHLIYYRRTAYGWTIRKIITKSPSSIINSILDQNSCRRMETNRKRDWRGAQGFQRFDESVPITFDKYSLDLNSMSEAQATPAAGERATDAEGHFIGHYQVAPGYMKDNDHITHGYRINFNTPRKIFRSLFMVHNESVNIWSHFLPAIIILGLLFSFYLVVDQTAVKQSILDCQTHIEEGLAHYSHALENLSLLADYRRLKEYTEAELLELQQTVLANYQQFSTKLKEGTSHYQFLIEQEVQGIRSNIKNSLKQNLVQFEKAKIQFEKSLAPMLVDELSGKLNKEWASKLKAKINELKEQVDSEVFQYVQLHQQTPNPQEISRWPIFVFLSSAALCLMTSTIFHLFYPMSSRTYTITNRFDYAGVNLLISGSAFPPLYYGMYCQLAVATLYLTLILITATFCFVVCLFEWIHRPGHEKYKAFLFGGFGVSMIIPISHMLINEIIYDNYGDPFEFSTSLPYYLLLGASYLTGLYVYTVRCPERNNPGKYNICGHSHQIWHGMVVLGIFFTYLGVLQNFEMRKVSYCPA